MKKVITKEASDAKAMVKTARHFSVLTDPKIILGNGVHNAKSSGGFTEARLPVLFAKTQGIDLDFGDMGSARESPVNPRGERSESP